MAFVFPLGLGVALALCLVPFPLGFLAPLPLIWILTRGGFRFGLLVGIGFFAVHLLWLPESFGEWFGPWGVAIFIPLILIKALMWAAVFGLTRGRPLARIGGWVLLEYLTSLGDLAFPWGFMGYALVDAPGRVLASLGGVYLLSLVVLLTALALSGRMYWAGAVWALLWLVPLPLPEGDQTALLAQANIDPRKKFEGISVDQLYVDMTREGLQKNPQVQVVVWPETAVYQFMPELPALLGQRELISGFETGSTNRVVRYMDGQVTGFYDKNRLVPFGERFPWRAQFQPLYSFIFGALGLGEVGDRPAGTGYPLLGRFGAFICYESVFPSVARILVRSGAEVLELGSNDGWYGPTFGGLQHFQMGRLRAVETGRWLLRAGNNGVTAIIDPYGRVRAHIPQHRREVLVGQFAYLKGQTLYVRLGDWAVLLAGVLLLLGLRKARKSPIV